MYTSFCLGRITKPPYYCGAERIFWIVFNLSWVARKFNIFDDIMSDPPPRILTHLCGLSIGVRDSDRQPMLSTFFGFCLFYRFYGMWSWPYVGDSSSSWMTSCCYRAGASWLYRGVNRVFKMRKTHPCMILKDLFQNKINKTGDLFHG